MAVIRKLPGDVCECGDERFYHNKPTELIPGTIYDGCSCIGCGCPSFSKRRAYTEMSNGESNIDRR